MTTVKTWILVIVLAIILIIGIGYLIRRKSYEAINELDRKKNNILKHAPYDEIHTIEKMPISGQSDEYRTELLKQWHDIEKNKYPAIEHHLFNAEQGTDKLRFKKAYSEQQIAREKLDAIDEEIEALKKVLNDFIRQEEANLKHINEIKSKYHEVRKALLARSFSFRNAASKLEDQLAEMEDDFTNFSNLTVNGDHEEANRVIISLNNKIDTMEQQMEEIPELFQKIDETYREQLKEIEQGYHYFLKNGYVFAEDDILREVKEVDQQLEELIKEIEDLDFSNVDRTIPEIEQTIEAQYKKMETEITAKANVTDLNRRNKQAIFYLKDEQKRLLKWAERLNESYYLNNNEIQKLNQQLTIIETEEKQYRLVSEKLINKKLPYSEAEILFERIFDQFQTSFKKLKDLNENLNHYRTRELELKEEQEIMEQAMYEMKREISNRRLPGINAQYMELFFSATDRIERLGYILSQPKLDVQAADKQLQLCQEDVDELKEWTKQIIDQSTLTEIISQRLMRYREEHPGVEETIDYSQTLFEKDYDYQTAFDLVQEKLKQIAPEELEEILEEYYQK